MFSWRFEETIDREPRIVWTYASDVARLPTWMGVIEARALDDRPAAIGARSINVFTLGPRRYDAEMEVSASEPGRRIAWRIVGGAPIDGEFILELEPDEGGRARAAWYGWIQARGLWRLVEPVLAGEAKKGEQAELRRLKAAVESLPASDGG